MSKQDISLIFEDLHPGRRALRFQEVDNKWLGEIPAGLKRGRPPELPEVTELELVRHFTRLSQRNFNIDANFYPLGSCTMKYNPKVLERAARRKGFVSLHPLTVPSAVKGCLRIYAETEECLKQICGMDAFSLQPAAGAQGELTGVKICRAYFESRGENRKKIIIPDTAHGTNPASAALTGYQVIEAKSDKHGILNPERLKQVMDKDVALIMITNPNTLGLFEEHILEISRIAHEAGALVYMDGANMNALLGIARPGDMGVDMLHLNLHKTFGSPHGSGGPGSGPLGVKNFLKDYLPVPVVTKKGDDYVFDWGLKHSIGRVHSFYGNFLVILRAFVWLKMVGSDGLRQISEAAIVNANYLKAKVRELLEVPYDSQCMHEFVASAVSLKQFGVRTLDIAKRLLDFGIHPPTIYFPLIVHEALMIEPTESESPETLDEFVSCLRQIISEAHNSPEVLTGSPHNMPVGRVDETYAARNPVLRWTSKS